MSKDIRKSAPKGTIARDKNLKIERYVPSSETEIYDRRIMTVEPNEAYWSALNLADLEILARRPNNRRLRTRIWEDSSGRWWRKGGNVFIEPGSDGRMRIWIVTLRGANRTDVRWLEDAIERAIHGEFIRFGWEPRSTARGDGWAYTLSRPYIDPFSHRDPIPMLEPCADQRCTERWHLADAPDHVAGHISDEDADYTIEVRRFEGRDEEYVVEMQSDSTLRSGQIPSLVSKLHWAATLCEQVNATPLDGVTKGIRDPEKYWELRNAAESARLVVEETNH